MIAVLNIPVGQGPVETLPAELVGAWAIVLGDDATAEEIGLRVSVHLPDTATMVEVGSALKAAARSEAGRSASWRS